MNENKFAGFLALFLTVSAVIVGIVLALARPITPKPKAKPAYCHACQCGKIATKCINECNSPKTCVIMCANQCNEKKMSVGKSPELQEDSNLINARFFGSSLPKITVYISNQKEDDWIGLTVQCGKNAYCITINTILAPAPREQQWVLRHEECHVATFTINEPAHGDKWEECMINLADKGAFVGVW